MFALPEKPAKSLGEALRQCRTALLALGVFSLFVNLLMLTGPLYMLQIYDRVLASGSMPTLLGLTLLITVLYAGLAGRDWIRQMLFTRAGSWVEDELAHPILEQMLSGKLSDPGCDEEKNIQDLRTVCRFFAPSALGAIFDIPFALGPQIGYLPQQVKLFSGTPKDNISRFEMDPSPEGIIAATPVKIGETKLEILGLKDAIQDETLSELMKVQSELSGASARKIFDPVLGVPVDGFIITRSRTVISYLTKPLADSFAWMFRE